MSHKFGLCVCTLTTIAALQDLWIFVAAAIQCQSVAVIQIGHVLRARRNHAQPYQFLANTILLICASYHCDCPPYNFICGQSAISLFRFVVVVVVRVAFGFVNRMQFDWTMHDCVRQLNVTFVVKRDPRCMLPQTLAVSLRARAQSRR